MPTCQFLVIAVGYVFSIQGHHPGKCYGNSIFGSNLSMPSHLRFHLSPFLKIGVTENGKSPLKEIVKRRNGAILPFFFFHEQTCKFSIEGFKILNDLIKRPIVSFPKSLFHSNLEAAQLLSPKLDSIVQFSMVLMYCAAE